MKILFINNFSGPDYLNDCIFHGLNSLDNLESLECTSNPWYMLSSYPNKSSLYGRGFTIFCTISNNPFVETKQKVVEKIKNKYYDKIIYGSIHRDSSFFDLVSLSYSKNDIIVLDGEDHTNIKYDLLEKCTYYKRELVDTSDIIHPISFSIPEEKIIKTYPIKDQLFGTVVPGNLKTYTFYNENDYYLDYSKSYYGITCKKGGWDCMRHYEILGSYSIPCFYNIEDCPYRILTNFPKKIILETNKYSLNNKIHPNYEELNTELHNYTLANLTTKKIAERLL